MIRPPVLALPALALLLGVGACAPGTPDEDSWRVDAIRAVGDVSSSVATMELALRRRDDLFHPYLETVAVQSERTAGQAQQKLSSRQPPDAYLSRDERVTQALDDASSLLRAVRVAVVRLAPEEYGDLLGRLSSADDRLTRLEAELRALPDDRSEP